MCQNENEKQRYARLEDMPKLQLECVKNEIKSKETGGWKTCNAEQGSESKMKEQRYTWLEELRGVSKMKMKREDTRN